MLAVVDGLADEPPAALRQLAPAELKQLYATLGKLV
jgi:hypothetical protein